MKLFGTEIAPFPECIGQFILALPASNPLRRWFENGLADIEAKRQAWRDECAREREETHTRIENLKRRVRESYYALHMDELELTEDTRFH